MILDLPPHIEQVIIAKAQSQGISPTELIARDYGEPDIFAEMEKHGLNSDGVNIVLTDEDARRIQEHLDSPIPPIIQELLAEIRGNV
ncbi:MAG: hypothetical protein Q4B79_01340 [Moraxella sp.]|uniref:hypothetical protein n=1 Tax=Moraxella sp. TaxID=479 RepID=UPI0026DB2AF5|nr:hypothetical protein [Moraxella sp.]MDO4449588.1 hypothetical protein [Moraxella sp.]